MLKLQRSLQTWNTPAFKETLKREIEQMDIGQLPLQQCLTQSSYALENDFNPIIISTMEKNELIEVKMGIFFSGVIPGCACADDPTPESKYTEYCEAVITINKNTAEASITPTSD